MRREGLPGDTALLRREWNLSFALVAAGHTVAGAIAIGLGAAAFVARWSAMRKENRAFYGQEKHPS